MSGALQHETLQQRHSLRGSVLPILALTYNERRGHILTVDEGAVRLWSTRRELAVMWLDPEAPAPKVVLYHRVHDVYLAVYDDEPAAGAHADAGAVQVLHASLAPLLRWRPHDGAVSAAALHRPSGILITSGAEGQLRLWELAAAGGDAEATLVVSPIASLNEHQPRGAISVLTVTDAGLLLGAIDGTVWIWRLFSAFGSRSRGAVEALSAFETRPETASLRAAIQPRLEICWEATPAESDWAAAAAPQITCVHGLGGRYVAVGLSDGVACVWGLDLEEDRVGAPELCCVLRAHVSANEDDGSSGSDDGSLEDGASNSSAAGGGTTEYDALPDPAAGVFAVACAEAGADGLEVFTCGGRDRALKHWLVGRRNADAVQTPMVARQVAARRVRPDVLAAALEDDGDELYVRAKIAASPMLLDVLPADGSGRRLLACTSGGLIMLYEVLAPQWHVANCADRVLQLRRGPYMACGGGEEACVVSLSDGGHVETISSKAGVIHAAVPHAAPAPPHKPRPPKLVRGRVNLVALGERDAAADRIALAWSGAAKALLLGRCDGCLELLEPDWRDAHAALAAIRDDKGASQGEPRPPKASTLLARTFDLVPRAVSGAEAEPAITCVTTLVGRKLVIVGDAEGGLRLFRLGGPGAKKVEWSTRAHAGAVVALCAGNAVAEDAILASASADGVVKVWQLDAARRPCVLASVGYFIVERDAVTALAMTHDGDEDFVVAGFASGNVEAWPVGLSAGAPSIMAMSQSQSMVLESASTLIAESVLTAQSQSTARAAPLTASKARLTALHSEKVTVLDAWPRREFVLSASLDRSIALLATKMGDPPRLVVLKCVYVAHAVTAAVLLRHGDAFEAVVAQGATVCRVALATVRGAAAEDRFEQPIRADGAAAASSSKSLFRSFEATLPSELLASAASTRFNTVVFESETTSVPSPPPLGQLVSTPGSLLRNRSPDHVSFERMRYAFAPPAGSVRDATPDRALFDQTPHAEAQEMPREMRTQTPGDFDETAVAVAEGSGAEDDADRPGPPLLPSALELRGYLALTDAFRQRAVGTGVVPGAALGGLLRQWWGQSLVSAEAAVDDAIVRRAADLAGTFAASDSAAAACLPELEDDFDFDLLPRAELEAKRAKKLANASQRHRRAQRLDLNAICAVAAKVCEVLDIFPGKFEVDARRGGGGWVSATVDGAARVKARPKGKKLNAMAIEKLRLTYSHWGEAVEAERTVFEASLAPPVSGPASLEAVSARARVHSRALARMALESRGRGWDEALATRGRADLRVAASRLATHAPAALESSFLEADLRISRGRAAAAAARMALESRGRGWDEALATRGRADLRVAASRLATHAPAALESSFLEADLRISRGRAAAAAAAAAAGDDEPAVRFGGAAEPEAAAVSTKAPDVDIMHLRRAIVEARFVFNAFATELFARRALLGAAPASVQLGEAAYAAYRVRFGPRKTAEYRMVSLLDALQVHGGKVACTRALSKFFGVQPEDEGDSTGWRELPVAAAAIYVDALAWLGDRNALAPVAISGGEAETLQRSAGTFVPPGGDHGIGCARRLAAGCARALASTPAVASAVVEALAHFGALEDGPRRRGGGERRGGDEAFYWDQVVDAEAFAELLADRCVASTELADAAAAYVFGPEAAVGRILTSRGGAAPTRAGTPAQKKREWEASLAALQELLRRFVAVDASRSGALPADAFCRVVRAGLDVHARPARSAGDGRLSWADRSPSDRSLLSADASADSEVEALGWSSWRGPGRVPQSASLLPASERDLERLVVLFRDEHDHQIAYIDFVAMLHTETVLRRKLPRLGEAYDVAIEQLIGMDDSLAVSLKTYVVHVDVSDVVAGNSAQHGGAPGALQGTALGDATESTALRPGFSQLVRGAVSPPSHAPEQTGPGRAVLGPLAAGSVLAAAAPGLFSMDAVRVPNLHPGTLRVQKPPRKMRAPAVALEPKHVSVARRVRQEPQFVSAPPATSRGPVEGVALHQDAVQLSDEAAYAPNAQFTQSVSRALTADAAELGQLLAQASAGNLAQASGSQLQAQAGTGHHLWQGSVGTGHHLAQSSVGTGTTALVQKFMLKYSETGSFSSRSRATQRSRSAASLEGSPFERRSPLDGRSFLEGRSPLDSLVDRRSTPAGMLLASTKKKSFVVFDDPFFAPRFLNAETAPRRADSVPPPLVRTPVSALGVTSLAGGFDALGRAASPIRTLPQDEIAQLAALLDKQNLAAEAQRTQRGPKKPKPNHEAQLSSKEDEKRRRLEEEVRRRADEAERRHAEFLERKRLEKAEALRRAELEALAAAEAQRLADLEALRLEELRLRQDEEEQHRLAELRRAEALKLKAEAKRKAADDKRKAADELREKKLADERALKAAAAAEKEARRQAEREAKRRAEAERAAMVAADAHSLQMRKDELMADELAERRRLEALAEAQRGREAAENALMFEEEVFGDAIRVEVQAEEVAAQAIRDEELLEAQRIDAERVAREREYDERDAMRVEDEAGRALVADALAVAASQNEHDELMRSRLDAEGRMKEENERSNTIVANLRVHPNRRALFRVSSLSRAANAFSKNVGLAALRKAAAAPEAAPVFGINYAFFDDLAYDPFATPAFPAGRRARPDETDDLALRTDGLPEAVRRAFDKAAGKGEKATFANAVSELYADEDHPVEADVVIKAPIAWEKYFDAKLQDLFAFAHDANGESCARSVPSAASSPGRGAVLRQELLRDAALLAVTGSTDLQGLDPVDPGPPLEARLGADAIVALPFGKVRHGRASILEGTAPAYFSLELEDPGAILTVMLVCISGDADLWVSRNEAPTPLKAHWADRSLKREKRCVASPADSKYGAGTYYVAVQPAAPHTSCRYAIYAAATVLAAANASDQMKNFEPKLRVLSRLGDENTKVLLADFPAAVADAEERVEREAALFRELQAGRRADGVASPSDEHRRHVSHCEAVRANAKRTADDAATPLRLLEPPQHLFDSPAAADDALDADEGADLDLWNVPLEAMDDGDDDEARLFETLLHRAGARRLKSEAPQRPPPPDLDALRVAALKHELAAGAPTATRRRRRRRKRDAGPELSIEEIDARMRATGRRNSAVERSTDPASQTKFAASRTLARSPAPAWMGRVGAGGDLFDDVPRPPPVRRPRWVPGFKEQVDEGVRHVAFVFEHDSNAVKSVDVTIEYRENGTGSSVWDAAIVLARYLELEAQRRGRNHFDGQTILELGSGTGFVGLVAAVLFPTANVVLTDLAMCLSLLEVNALKLRPHVQVSVEALAWGDPTFSQPDVVLVADCLLPGSTHLFPPLVKTLASLLYRRAAYALFAYEERMDCSDFFKLVEDAGLVVERVQGLHPTFSAPEIHVLRISPDVRQ
ncbi:hypothetical protein M885DRAFT_560310 [Pelagophyceae sp. CCMP2097]|nr:hypothetical protein M885DRAFT_560310 [Pelagophyceae sp. CCMP2097]